jgi:phosphoglycolate phosphatase
MHVIFDLDGTLVDSRLGIERCFRHALAELGREIAADSRLARCIGPPIARSFELLLGTSDPLVVERAIAVYRGRFEAVGIFENALYPGVTAALQALVGAGHDLHVVTAKPSVYARRIIELRGIDRFIMSVSGPELGEPHRSKDDLLREALERHGMTSTRAVMVGDRADDVIAARRQGVRAVGAAWGYAEPGELADVRPERILNSWTELVAYIQALPG